MLTYLMEVRTRNLLFCHILVLSILYFQYICFLSQQHMSLYPTVGFEWSHSGTSGTLVGCIRHQCQPNDTLVLKCVATWMIQYIACPIDFLQTVRPATFLMSLQSPRNKWLQNRAETTLLHNEKGILTIIKFCDNNMSQMNNNNKSTTNCKSIKVYTRSQHHIYFLFVCAVALWTITWYFFTAEFKMIMFEHISNNAL